MSLTGEPSSGFAQKVLRSLRSRRKHKAWGASPRIIEQNDLQPVKTGGSLKIQAVARCCGLPS
jgi:hypothetical protein